VHNSLEVKEYLAKEFVHNSLEEKQSLAKGAPQLLINRYG